jgi:Rod binding domain-containing protein
LSDIVAGMTKISTSGDGLTAGDSGKKDTPEAIAKAASQFEALLIGQLLQSARAGDDDGWFGTDESDAGSTMTEMSEQVLSSTLASKGGLGLAKLITKGMEKSSDHAHKVKQEG